MDIKYDIVIPAYNSHDVLPLLLEQINQLNHPPQTVFIIDDGSKFEYTLPAYEKFEMLVERLPKNTGKGAAIKKGIELFLQKNRSPFLLLMDADGQHPVSKIKDFLQKAKSNHTDLIIGHRKQKFGYMPWLRIFSNTTSSLIVSWVSGYKIPDSQCGFRLLKREVVEKLDLKENGFQIETELILKSLKNGFRIEFVPIPTIYNGQKSYIKHFNDTIRFLSIILKELFSK